jgi:hypothetical protein
MMKEIEGLNTSGEGGRETGRPTSRVPAPWRRLIRVALILLLAGIAGAWAQRFAPHTRPHITRVIATSPPGIPVAVILKNRVRLHLSDTQIKSLRRLAAEQQSAVAGGVSRLGRDADALESAGRSGRISVGSAHDAYVRYQKDAEAVQQAREGFNTTALGLLAESQQRAALSLP